MCGIAGIISFNQKEEHIRHIFEMHARMQHRGPDDDGFAFFSENGYLTLPGKNTPESVRRSGLNYCPANRRDEISPDHFIALAHNRLSVIDISHYGHQPMCEEDGQYWIVYNGEVYNFPELRRELSEAGYSFRTNTDTEVVLKAYMEWGTDCIHRFNGMWAFVIYDRKHHMVFASRDRFGVKPFYYKLNDDVFAFASEQKALYHFPGSKDRLNPDAVFDYLAMGKLELEPEGLVKGIMELPPAHFITIDLRRRKTKIQRYYELDYTRDWGKYNQDQENEYTLRLREQLREAIRIRLNSDVPVGTCLSGGIDSSILVSIVNHLLSELKLEQLGSRQKTFTASYENELIDESGYAQMIVNETGAEWHQVFPTAKEMISEFEKIVRAQDIPFLSSSTYSQFKVMELAGKNGVTVTLDGQGADELFGGYAPHYSSYMMHALKRMDFPSFISGTADMRGNFANWSMITGFPLKFQLAKAFKHSFYRTGYKQGKPETHYIRDDFWDGHNKRLQFLFEKYGSNFNAFLSSQFQGDEFKNLMRTGDRNAMAFSIESRMPFADDINMIESTFKIPAVYKVRKGYSKSLLRKAAAGQVPAAILQRRDKVGFATPERKWFNEAGHELKGMLPEQDDEYVSWHNLSMDWDNLLKDPRTTTARMWRLVNFAVWRKVFDY